MHDLRAEFPVFERLAYLNTGSNGPVPRRAVEAAAESMRLQLAEGRGDRAHFEATAERIDSLRGRVAGLLGCETGEVALTGSTTDGVNAVLAALDLGPGDDVLTSDEEHPGVLAPLAALRERRGVSVRMVPVAELGGEVRPQTRLVACSHVSWMTGAVADTAALAAGPALVLLDGAQGLGAVPTNVAELGCDFYAASGQKWLCGPNGLGYLYVRGELAAELPPPWPNYGVLVDSANGVRARAPPGRPALLHRLSGAPPDRVGAGRARRTRAGRPRGRAGAGGRPGGRPGARTRRPRERRAGAPRSSPGRTPIPRRRSSGCARRASSFASCPAGASCARPSGRGRPRTSSSGWSALATR